MKKIIKISYVLLIIFTFSLILISPNKNIVQAKSESYIDKVQEYRAVWVSHFAGDISQYTTEEAYKAQITTILNNMEEWGMNALVFHVRTHNNAFYKSTLNPKSRYYNNVNFDEFDPVEWIIEECHKRGIEFHAWLNPYRVSTSGNNPDYTYEELPAGNAANNPENLITVGNNIILDPGRPAVREFIVDTCMELIENYDVDAINFDDYFYITDADDSATREIYNTENLSIADFRRKQVNLLIEALHNSITAYNLENNKAVEIGIAPSGVYRNGSYSSGTIPTYNENGDLTYPLWSNTAGFAHYGNYLYSDTKYWIDQEWIDYITPQSYHAIKQTSSSFSKLTEWWNWVVANKKVNLSMGVGIYMAISTGGSADNWQDADEVENQLLDANSYENIGGLCFYKYATFLSSSSLITAAKETLNTYWTKKIPSSVKPQHTNLPDIIVSNLLLDGNTLSWSKIDNVRGYMVYKVEKGKSVDVNSFDQLYLYTQDTSITLDDMDNYTYYVSSVNLANEISAPASYDSSSLVDSIIALINGIEFPITLDMEEQLNNIKARYLSLDSSYQANVTNYYILENALEKIQELKDAQSIVDRFLQEIPKDISKKYFLPLYFDGYKATWEYADNNSASFYNIETGKVLVEYLATTYVNLKYTLTNNVNTYTGTVKINVGYCKTDEVGLFYRNTPNALNKDEDPSANVSYIGWGGKTLEFTMDGTRYIYYNVVGNYHELSSSDIPSNGWSSCGDIYYNLSGSTITATASDFDVNTSNGYGYFIIGSNNQVRVATSSATASDIITLYNNEILYCVKYLDGLISPTVMKPASNFTGLTVELKTPNLSNDLTNSEEAEIIDNLILNLDSNVNIFEKEEIERCRRLYNNASSEVKALVTHINTLENLEAELAIVIENQEEIEELRNQAINTISNYITDLTIYSQNGQNTIQTIITLFEQEVLGLNTEADINSLVNTYKERLDNVLTEAEEDQDEIDDAINEAISELNVYLDNINDYSASNQEIIINTVNTYTTSINNSNTLSKVEELLNEALEILNNIPKHLDEAKAEKIVLIEELSASINYDNYSQYNKTVIKSAIATTKAKINKATSVEEVEGLYNTLIETIDGIETLEEVEARLNQAKSEAIEYINNYLDYDYYRDEKIEEANSIISEYTSLINASTTQSQVNNYKIECANQLDTVDRDPLLPTRKDYIEKITTYYESVSKFSDPAKAKNIYDKFNKDIYNKETKAECDEFYNETLSSLKALKSSGSSGMSCSSGIIVVLPLLMISSIFIFIKKKH